MVDAEAPVDRFQQLVGTFAFQRTIAGNELSFPVQVEACGAASAMQAYIEALML